MQWPSHIVVVAEMIPPELERLQGELAPKVDRIEPGWFERRRHPYGRARTERVEGLSKPGQLGGRRNTAPHELRLVEYPEAVVIQEAEVDRPVESAGRVPAVQRP